MPALDAGDKLVRAAAVEEEDALLAALEVPLQLGAEQGAYVPAVAPAQLGLEVDNRDLGQGARVESAGSVKYA